MPYDAGEQYHPLFDMCGYCNLDTGGQHMIGCPLYPHPVTDALYCAYKETHPEFAEWDIKYL